MAIPQEAEIRYGTLYTRLYEEDLEMFGSPEGIAKKVIVNTHDTFDYVVDSCKVVTNRDFPGAQFIEAEYTYCKH